MIFLKYLLILNIIMFKTYGVISLLSEYFNSRITVEQAIIPFYFNYRIKYEIGSNLTNVNSLMIFQKILQESLLSSNEYQIKNSYYKKISDTAVLFGLSLMDLKERKFKTRDAFEEFHKNNIEFIEKKFGYDISKFFLIQNIKK